MSRSGNEPCAPRTQILASRLLDIGTHDEAYVDSMAVVFSDSFRTTSDDDWMVVTITDLNDLRSPVTQPQCHKSGCLFHIFQANMIFLGENSKESCSRNEDLSDFEL